VRDTAIGQQERRVPITSLDHINIRTA